MNDVLMAALSASLVLESLGHRAVVVGGAVRDCILCRETGEADITTSACTRDILEAWPGSPVIGREPETTVIIRHAGMSIDVSSFNGYSLEEDLGRRDLSVNSIAMTSGGEIIDPWGGAADIASGILRFTRDPFARLSEDPLRAVRLARFASLLNGFSIDPGSTEVCRGFSPAVASLPGARVGKEVLHALEGDLPLFISTLEKLGILGSVLPFVKDMPPDRREATVGRVILAVERTSDPAVRAACLMADIAEIAGETAVSWGWPRSLVRDVVKLVKYRRFPADKIDPRLLAGLFRTPGKVWLNKLFLFGLIDCLNENPDLTAVWAGNRLEAVKSVVRLERMTGSISGNDVMALTGLKSGPAVGELLAELDEAVSLGLVSDREGAFFWLSSRRNH